MAQVLVVDDEPDIRLLVQFALEGSGYSVRTAEDGAAALAVLEEDPPDAMVLDVMMPHTDGFAVLRSMRDRGLARNTRVVILTCRTEERHHMRGWELGAHEYLTKPFDPEELVDRVRDLLASSSDLLEERRKEELEKAELLERLEAAFERQKNSGASPEPQLRPRR